MEAARNSASPELKVLKKSFELESVGHTSSPSKKRGYAPAQKKKNASFMKFKTVLKLEIFISSSSKVLGLVVVRHCEYNPEPEIVNF